MALADPALDYPLPNAALLVRHAIHVDGIADPTVYEYANNALRSPIGWLTAQSVRVDVRARTQTICRDRADRARRIILGLPSQPWPPDVEPIGVVVNVVPVFGPDWQPEPTNGQPCYVAMYEIHVHPALPRSTRQVRRTE